MTAKQERQELEPSFEERIAALEAQKRGSRWSKVKVAIVALLVSVGIAVIAASLVVDRQNRIESKARQTAVRVGYQNQLASCRRGISVRNDLRTYGQEFHLVGNVFVGFFGTAVRRARAQSVDPSVSSATRAAAKAALPQYTQFVATVKLLTMLPIPPTPLPCDEVITNPNAPPLPHHS